MEVLEFMNTIKKLISIILILLSSPLTKATKISTGQKIALAGIGSFAAWRAIPHIETYLSSEQTPQGINHDPHVSAILDPKEGKIPVVVAMGWSDHTNMYKNQFDTDGTFTVTFEYKDSCYHTRSSNPLQLCKGIRNSNFGQEYDAKTLIHVLHKCYESGYRSLYLFGNSRGGATTITALDILSNPQKHAKIWNELGITNTKTQKALRNMVEKGSIFLAHPLLNQSGGISQVLERQLKPLQNFSMPLFDLIKKFCFASTSFILQASTNYNPNTKTPLKIIQLNQENKNWNYKITIALANNDKFIRPEYTKILKRLQSNKIILGIGGKHHKDFKPCIYFFNQIIKKDWQMLNQVYIKFLNNNMLKFAFLEQLIETTSKHKDMILTTQKVQ